ncbi:MAG: hypothetical protein Q8877_02970, partial [Sweet potato little leaf phytoplasma]|nr:hypothetical protein [Sweet potato little leaf phytoplasma]
NLGYLPEAILNFLFFLGFSIGSYLLSEKSSIAKSILTNLVIKQERYEVGATQLNSNQVNNMHIMSLRMKMRKD